MKRKAIQIAKRTMCMTLPNGFVRRYGIEKGHDLEVIEHDDRIEIMADANQHIHNVSVNIDDPRKLKETIRDLFLCGFDVIEVKLGDSSMMKSLMEYIEENRNYELLRSSRTCAKMKRVVGFDIGELDNIMQRIFFLLKEEIRLQLEQIRKTGEKRGDNHFIRHASHLLDGVYRILHLKVYTEPTESLILYRLIHHLELFVDDVISGRKYVDQKTIMDLEYLRMSLNPKMDEFDIREDLLGSNIDRINSSIRQLRFVRTSAVSI